MKYIRLLCLILFFLLCWQIIVMCFHLPDYILPTPINVLKTLYSHRELIFHESILTIYETLFGLILGILFGSIAAIVMSFSRSLAAWFLPIFIISQAIPTFAIAPLFVIWFGFGFASKIATTVLMLFFPITSSLYDGLNRTNHDWLDLGKTLQSKTWRVFWHIRIPAALPSFASGLRIAAVVAPIGAIIGEWVGASHGLGYLMLNANARLQIDLMFAALFIIVLLSLALYFSTNYFLQRLIWWKT